MPNAQPVPSHNAFFSPQTAFYSPSSQPPMPSQSGMPGMEFLSNNPLLNVGYNVVEQGMRDFTGKTVNMLPNEVRSQSNIDLPLMKFVLTSLDEEIHLIYQILFRCRSNVRGEKVIVTTVSLSSAGRSRSDVINDRFDQRCSL